MNLITRYTILATVLIIVSLTMARAAKPTKPPVLPPAKHSFVKRQLMVTGRGIDFVEQVNERLRAGWRVVPNTTHIGEENFSVVVLER